MNALLIFCNYLSFLYAKIFYHLQRSSISRHGCPAFHQQAISSILNNFIDKLSVYFISANESLLDVRNNIIADDVVQHQNKRRFQRKPDKQHHLYSVWPITLYNSSKYVSPNDGKLTIF
ncbi:hypothetical protein T05_13300, partial [Trichinella murrelli]